MNDIRTLLREHIRATLKDKGENTDFTDDSSLFAAGRLSSLDAIKTVMYLEENFGINFSKIGFDQAFIDSIDAMANLVEEDQKK